MKKVRSLPVTPEAPVSESAIRLSNRYDMLESEEPVMQPMSVGKREFQLRRRQCHVSNLITSGRELENDLLRVKGKVNGRRATTLIDSRSTHDFISGSFVQSNNMTTHLEPETLHVTLADGSSSSRHLQTVGPLRVVIKDFSDDQLFTVFPLTRCDIILGKPWLTRNNPTINYKTNEVQLHCEPFVANSYTVKTTRKWKVS